MKTIQPPQQITALAGRGMSVLRWLRFLRRNRYQLIGATLLAVALPAAIRTGLGNLQWGPGSPENTVVGTFVAMLLGAWVLRRMTFYPGVRIIAYVLPAFLLSYGIVIVIFFFSRFDYSRLQFAMSFVMVVTWFGLLGLIEPHIRRPTLALLPFGGAQRATRSGRAHWRLWTSSNSLPVDADGVVVDLHADLDPEWERFVAQATLAGLPVYHWKQIVESLTGTVEMEHLSENTFGALLPSSTYLRFKRLVDCTVAVLSSPVALPLAAATAAAIWLTDSRPILFRQERVGFGGKPFVMFKFRTMNGADGQPFTEEGDPRITALGRFLRRYRIDELPQIINILRGEMSWIGPRPEAIELAKWYESQIPFYSYRHTVRPGITGWAQVNQGNVAEVEAATGKLQYDFYYIKYFSPWLDLLISAKTIYTVLSGHGAR